MKNYRKFTSKKKNIKWNKVKNKWMKKYIIYEIRFVITNKIYFLYYPTLNIVPGFKWITW